MVRSRSLSLLRLHAWAQTGCSGWLVRHSGAQRPLAARSRRSSAAAAPFSGASSSAGGLPLGPPSCGLVPSVVAAPRLVEP